MRTTLPHTLTRAVRQFLQATRIFGRVRFPRGMLCGGTVSGQDSVEALETLVL